MFKIFLVQRQGQFSIRDENLGHVVVASTPEVARAAAARRCADEGALIWYDVSTTVLEIGNCTDDLLGDGTVLLTDTL